ncbi:MAG: restriction endonuclease subunit R [Gammaproteobacteria bacterium]|nr:MAG: restriction endonuclease subunit R [Gammaproteobacteria bacterium]PHR85041.1 MAG: restriction endonuclease subunit R [Colwellia sp.]
MNTTGIYEQLITQLVEQNLDRETFHVGERSLEAGEAATWLSRFLTRLIEIAMDSVPHGDARINDQISLANTIVQWLSTHIKDEQLISENLIASRGKILTALFDKTNPIAADLPKYVESIMPLTGLTQSELFCGSNVGVSLETEIKREIQSSDEIYWLVSFIKWTGIRIFKKELESFTRSGKQLKIITTSYMGATDAKAVEFLASLPNTEVKLSYNTNRERLHAKSYLFMRNTGFHTGYIGSSNLSHSALTSGLEWNLKITSQEIPHIINKSLSTFETYWQSPDFEHFDGKAPSKEKLNNALREAKGSFSTATPSFYFDIKPHSHQQTILDKLQTERDLHKRYRNLVVAATGTGKTIISAFDFARFYNENPEANFLFIAHREEILKQALAAYRGVLKNSAFGELWVGNHKPNTYQHLFASIQSLNAQLSTVNNNQTEKLALSEDYFDYIVIDEVHHISASSYRAVLAHFSPKILLGLTATPERHDGTDILSDFCNVIAAEIRLPEAINQRHLSPFQYFGIDDDTDLTKISWSKGRYDIAELTHLYTYNDQRVLRILQSLEEVVTDIAQMRALAFCVSKEHAKFMAQKFTLHNIACGVLTSDNSKDREVLQQQLKSKQINVLFVVDIFNEGVDIPELDTLLFLRPTESLTIFLQQLGRGLRLTDNKECCTILDFVGNSRPEYDFSHKFRALVGKTNQAIAKEVKQGFPHLPLGCRIELQEKTQAMILKNISQATLNKNKLLSLINNFPHNTNLPLTLTNFLQLNPNLTLEDIYKVNVGRSKKGGGWSALLAASKNKEIAAADKALYSAYYRAINNRLLNCSSISYLRFIKTLCDNSFSISALNTDVNLPKHQQLFALMTHYDFWDKTGKQAGFSDVAISLLALRNTTLLAELADVITLLIERLEVSEFAMPTVNNSKVDASPLKMHVRYPKEHILVAFGDSTFTKKSSSREGVLNIADANTELLFVTLDKCEKQFSATTMYHDYAISPTLFHWQTQNSARPNSGRGLAYITQKETQKTFLLFVREQGKDENGRTIGFVNFGPVDFVKYEGSQPMNITWKLKHPMPAYLWHETAKLAVG